MKALLERLAPLFALFRGLFSGVRSVASPALPKVAAQPAYPALPPGDYEARLRNEIAKKGQPPHGYEATKDDPKTKANERRTFCNFFTRAVCAWFGWRGFESADRDQAGEITRWMRAHPETFKPVTFEEGAELAARGCLVIAGQEQSNPPPTGHVCVIAPSKGMIFSAKWQRPVPYAANVGADNWYGKGLNYAFGKQPPELFVYTGAAPKA